MRNRLVRTAVLAALSSAGALSVPYALGGEIVFDGSLAGTTAGALNAVNGSYAITQNRGFLNGSNLFHSFDVFDLNQGETAVFSGDAAIANIISRITGGLPTNIDGTIRSTIDGANFWMVNPAGLTVGPSGAIDVSGAIALGTADSIDFGSGQRFFALPGAGDVAVSLLVSSPVDFGFLENSVAGELVIQNGEFVARSTLVAEQRQIQPLASNPTLNKFSLLLSGGAGVFLDSRGDLSLDDARVRSGSVWRTNGSSFTGPIDLTAVGSIEIRNSDLMTSMGVGATGGEIFIQGGELVTISRSSLVTESIQAGVPTGDIAITGAGVLIGDQALITANFKAKPNPPPDPDEERDPDAIDPQEGVGAGSISILASGRSGDAAPQLQLSAATSGVVRIVDSAVVVSNAGGQNVPGGGGIRIGRTDQYSFEEPRKLDGPFENVFGADQVVIAGSMLATDATDDGAADDIQLGGRQGVWITTSSTGGYRDGGRRLDATSTISARADNSALSPGQISVRAGAAGVSIDRGTLDTTNAVPGDEVFIMERRFDFDDIFKSDVEILSLGHIALEHATLRTDSTGIKGAGDMEISGDTVRINGGQLTTSVSTLRPRDQPGSSDYKAGDISIFAAGGPGQPALVIENGAVVRANSTNNGNPLIDPQGAAAGSISLESRRGTIRVSNATLESSSDGLNGDHAGQITMTALGMIDIADTTISVAALSQNPNAFTGGNDNIGNIELFADEGALSIARSQLTASSTAVGVAGSIRAIGTSVDIVDSQLETSSTGKGGTGSINVAASSRDFDSTDTALRIVNSSLISASVGLPTTIGSDITIQTSSGGIAIDRATFNSSVASDGTGSQEPFGGLLVEASIRISAGTGGSLKVTDSSLQTTTSSSINGGDISLFADAIWLRGSTLSASSDAPLILVPTDPDEPVFAPQRGNAGSIEIAARGPTFALGGFGFPWPDMPEAPPPQPLIIESTSIITTATANRGGDISINAGGGLLRLSDSTLLASAGGMGAGGNISIAGVGGATLQATDVLALAESGTAGTVSIELRRGAVTGPLQVESSRIATNATNSAGGSITLDAAGNQFLLEDSSIVASAGGVGIGGDIRIDNAAGVTLQDSQVQALANAGTGGTIAIALTEGVSGSLQINDTQIATSATAANGGDISFQAAGHQVQVRGSSIVASAGGSGTGGGIAILNAAGATVQDSQFQALASAGSGGTISLTLATEARSNEPGGPLVFDNSTITTNATSANGGSILLDAAGQQVVMRGSAIVASAGGSGMGGDISILNAGGATLQASQIQALANAGAGGTISIDLTGVTGPVVLDGSSITTNATAADGGSISLDAAGNHVVMRNSSVVASAGGAGMGGDISILNAGGAMLLDSQIQALANAGAGGTINIDLADDVAGAVVFDNSSITANAAAADGGSISLDAAGNQVVMRNSSIVASAGGSGMGGDIAIANAGGATLHDTQIQALANAGAGGTISIDMADGVSAALVIDNSSITTNAAAADGGSIALDAAGNQVVMRNSSIVASAGGSGVGGDISITNAGGATLQNTQIQALANAGAGGTISIALNGQGGPVVLDNSSITTNAAAANGGNISLDAAGNQLLMRDSSIVASAGGSGIGGDISIVNAAGATLQNSQIQALADAGAGGTIKLALAKGAAPLILHNSAITTNAMAAGGGDISLDAAGNPVVMRDSTIRASAGAAGAGGNILIDNAERTLLQRSQILARADAGNGGTITLNLNTGALFIRDAQSILSADSNSGNDGAIDINSPDTDLNPAVKPQEIGIGSTPELSANACIPAAAAARSTFVRENRGGVSTSPDGYLASVGTASASQETASAATRETLRVAMADANASATEGCR